MLQEVANPLQDVNPYAVSAGNKMSAADDSAMINVPKFDSAPERGDIKTTLGSTPATHITAPPAVFHSRPPLGSSSREAEALAGSSLPRLPTSGNEGNASSAGSIRSSSMRPSRTSAGAGGASVPELFRQRSHMPLDEVEMGPLLGRGAYGRVFKGAPF